MRAEVTHLMSLILIADKNETRIRENRQHYSLTQKNLVICLCLRQYI